jgi:hypothetical protein
MISQCWCRLRIKWSVGHFPGRFAHPRRGLGPALFRLEPPSDLRVLFLPPCLLLLMFLKGLPGSFRHGSTPAKVLDLQRRPAHVPSREACASGALGTPRCLCDCSRPHGLPGKACTCKLVEPVRLRGPSQDAALAGGGWLSACCRRATSASRSATWGRFGSSSRDR